MATDLKRIMEQLLGGTGGLGGLLRGGQAAPPPGAPPSSVAQPGSGGLGGMLGSGGLGGLLGGGGLSGGLGDILGRLRGPMGGAGQAAAAGGLLGSVLGGRGGGGLLRVGGMALLGLLAHRAYGQWKAQQDTGAAVPPADAFAQPGAADSEGKPFGLSVIRAMVAAARADGQLDAQEHERIFAEAERMALSEEEKGEIFGVLETPADPLAIARLAASDAQKAELYLASSMAMGGADSASERAYLSALAGALKLTPELRAQLDAQLAEAKAAQPPA
ncbi:tellurite resistance TerB family protein [Plastoroseomonas arctica]|uniref:Tellurite resistance TerB family protein n=1 Tax=Plastoroseomonas arctica TaxID=1509237 RepID=A0AAF1KUF8_9PROT|nr:DUF533 domain-containing protein [Plastoroseomonas arctica]MBR0656097.1 tellurite resistance TerB family protein [Plastoroseomonas arctica]